MPSRRDALKAIGAVGAAATLGADSLIARLAAQHPCAEPGTAGILIGTLPLTLPGAPVQPFGVKIGSGLDARLVTDLSILEPERLITPNALAFIRTDCPPAAAAAQRGPWSIRTSGLVREGSLPLDALLSDARDMGAHLFECSGNNNPANFGLMSVAEWTGVPLVDVVSRLKPASRASAVLVSGMDHETKTASSTPGASWVFPLEGLDRLGAFLAVRMNGEPLPPDHGMPVRLVVPGWYACAWIKWVDEIRLVSVDEPSTSQMREFAGRTHQTARHDLAKDYAPADIQTAATSIRVEKRRDSAGLFYRIVGVVWGGTRTIDRLAIRFAAQDSWSLFPICPPPTTHTIWSLWEYRWKPPAPGLYSIDLTVPDSTVPDRRLEQGYYIRRVNIEEI